MTSTLSNISRHLESLVAFDTQNPPRAINSESQIFHYLKEHLLKFEFKVIDAGNGCLSLLAIRGNPEILFNFHIDTVPIVDRWKSNPFQLKHRENCLIGLGACDIKGAIACMLSAVKRTRGDVALLFSSDEEHGSSEAINKFLTTMHGFEKVVVAEPTKAKAVIAHRGIQTASSQFFGKSGHASEMRSLKDNAIHKAGHWISEAIAWVESQSNSVENLSGLPFNIGVISGGVKANIISSHCEIKFGFRPLPGQNSGQILKELESLSAGSKIKNGFFGPCLPAANQDFMGAINKGKQLADQLNIEVGNAVDFWTEASLFSQAGLCALVFGPGDIAQAHSANEWVDTSQLERVEQIYTDFLTC